SAMEQERHAVSSVARPPAPGHIGAMPEPVILVDNLVKRYGTTLAVDGISFAVGRGVTTALLGGNGAGKTTTLAILLGLLLPTSGSVHIFGEDVLRHRYRVLPRINFSTPYVDLPHRLTVRQNLTIYARLYGVPRREGRIVDRGSPQALIDRYGRTNLEEVFLHIARARPALEAAQ